MVDLAMLRGKNIKTHRPSTRFDIKMHGPFQVIKTVLPIAYRLKLTKHWSIHPTGIFYISFLELYRKSIDPDKPPPDLD
jgi:hypothetical protein